MTVAANTKIGIAKESQWGQAPAAFELLPVDPTPKLDTNYEKILDQGLRGSPAMDWGVYQGVGLSEVGLSGIFHPEEIGFFLYGIFGGYSYAGGTPGTHTFALNAGTVTPPSFTVQDYPVVGTPGAVPENICYQYRGCLVSSFTLKFAAGEGAVTWDVTMNGKAGTPVAPSAVTGDPGAPFLGWMGSVDLGGATFAKLIDCEFTFARTIVLEHCLQNTRDPAFGFADRLEVTARASAKFMADADYGRYREFTQTPFVVTLSKGSGATLKTLTVTCTSMSFADAPTEIDRSGTDVKLNMSMRAVSNATDAGPCKVVLKNTHISYAT